MAKQPSRKRKDCAGGPAKAGPNSRRVRPLPTLNVLEHLLTKGPPHLREALRIEVDHFRHEDAVLRFLRSRQEWLPSKVAEWIRYAFPFNLSKHGYDFWSEAIESLPDKWHSKDYSYDLRALRTQRDREERERENADRLKASDSLSLADAAASERSAIESSHRVQEIRNRSEFRSIESLQEFSARLQESDEGVDDGLRDGASERESKVRT